MRGDCGVRDVHFIPFDFTLFLREIQLCFLFGFFPAFFCTSFCADAVVKYTAVCRQGALSGENNG